MKNNQSQLPSFVPEWAKQMVLGAAQKYNIPAAVLASLLQQESGYNIHAQSSAGAQGIAQFMPGTAAGMHINPFNPAQAIDGAAHYLRNAMDHFGGSVPLALAAYNAGSGAVQQYGGIPPYPETQNYVRNIMAMSGQTGAQPAMQQQQQGPPPQGQGAIPPTQINNPAGQAPMPRMRNVSIGGAQGGQTPSQIQPRTNPYNSVPWNMGDYHGGLEIMMNMPSMQNTGGGLPTTAFNPSAPSRQQGQQQQAPISLQQILAQGNANVPSISTPSTPTAAPSSILPFLTGGSS